MNKSMAYDCILLLGKGAGIHTGVRLFCTVAQIKLRVPVQPNCNTLKCQSTKLLLFCLVRQRGKKNVFSSAVDPSLGFFSFSPKCLACFLCLLIELGMVEY
uniref:Uncharacterized protein n=1 Tax=Anguilla anguilla TaxID=7936 RepID=A0A0E9X123_ANGAN